MRFFCGFGIGIALGLLYAPASGKTSRNRLVHKIQELSHLPEQKVAELAEEGKEKAGELGARVGRQAAEAAVQAVADDLREKTKTA